MSETTAPPGGPTVNFTRDREDLDACREALRDLPEKGRVLLNQFVHDPLFFQDRTLPDEVPVGYRNVLVDLREGPLLRENDRGVVVPDDVKYLPEGPGVRRDQWSGVFHRLETSALRDWLGLVDDEDPASVPEWLLYRRLASSVADRCAEVEDRLSRAWPDLAEPWLPPEELGLESPGEVSGFFDALDPENSVVEACVTAGLILPVWNADSHITAFVLESSYRERPSQKRNPETTIEEHREVEWERKPFTPAEQLKFLMIAADAVPFRLTRDREPHRFDLKEVARVSEWTGEHLEFLTFLLLENGFLAAGDERFFISERGQDWDQGSGSLDPFFTCFGPALLSELDGPGPRAPDLSMGRLFRRTLRVLERSDGRLRLDHAVDVLLDEPLLADALMALDSGNADLSEDLRTLAEDLFETLHDFGLSDRLDGGDHVFYRLNDRGRELLSSGELRGPENEELPYILQPDGQLLVPLESPLEEFRRLNPFTLLVKADRMIGYQIDRQSLVQALNEGWNAGSFLEFLREKTDSIPDPLQDLFEDTIGNVKSINVEKVHHLIEFEDGATAAKAANVLNNYDPRRIDETTLVLRSETSPKTIRRNLSRGGIRLSGGDVDAGRSPLKEPPGES